MVARLKRKFLLLVKLNVFFRSTDITRPSLKLKTLQVFFIFKSFIERSQLEVGIWGSCGLET